MKKFKIKKNYFLIESWTLPIQLWSVMFHNLTDPSQDEDNAYSSLGCKATDKIGASWPANVTFLNVSVWIKVKVISALPAKTCLSMTSRQVASALNFVIVPSGSPLPSLKSKERLQFDDFFFLIFCDLTVIFKIWLLNIFSQIEIFITKKVKLTEFFWIFFLNRNKDCDLTEKNNIVK